MEEDQFNQLVEKMNDIQSEIPSGNLTDVENKLDEVIKLLKKIEAWLVNIDGNTSK